MWEKGVKFSSYFFHTHSAWEIFGDETGTHPCMSVSNVASELTGSWKSSSFLSKSCYGRWNQKHDLAVGVVEFIYWQVYIKHQIRFPTDLTAKHFWFTLHRYNKGLQSIKLNGSNCILNQQRDNLIGLGHTIYIIESVFFLETHAEICRKQKVFWCFWQIYWVKG